MAAPSDEQDELLQKLRKLINASGEKEDTFGSEMADDARVWRVYAKAARKHDGELLAQWNGTLDTLLIFAGLFSAVSTTFIIDSYKQMQPDYAQETFRLLLANASGTQYVEPSDHVAESARAVNCLWISSLIASLSTALIAILAKQWLASYSVSDRENLREWAQLRQYRFDALQLWHVPVLIAVVPVLLHVSLMLFLAGLVVFLWDIDTGTMILALVLSSATYSLYGFTTLSPVLWSSSPFRTPLTPVLKRIAHRVSPIGNTPGVILIQGLYSLAIGATHRLYCTAVRIATRVLSLIGKVMDAVICSTLLTSRVYDALFPAVHAVMRRIVGLYSRVMDAICHFVRLYYTAVQSFSRHAIARLSHTSHWLARRISLRHRSTAALPVDPWITQTVFSPGLVAGALSWLGLCAETTDIYHTVVDGLGDAVRGEIVVNHLSPALKSRISIQSSELISEHSSSNLLTVVIHLRAAYHLRSLSRSRDVATWVDIEVNSLIFRHTDVHTPRYCDTILRVSAMLEEEEKHRVLGYLSKMFRTQPGQEVSESPSLVLPSTVRSIVQLFIDTRDHDGSAHFRNIVLAGMNALRSHFAASPDLSANLLRCSFANEELSTEYERPLRARPTHDCNRALCEAMNYLVVILERHDFESYYAFESGYCLKAETFSTLALFCRNFPHSYFCHNFRSNMDSWLSREKPLSKISLCGRDIAAFLRCLHRPLPRTTGLRLIRQILHPEHSWSAPDSSDPFRNEALDACVDALFFICESDNDFDLRQMGIFLDEAGLEPLQRAPQWNDSLLLGVFARVLDRESESRVRGWASEYGANRDVNDGLRIEDLVSKFIFCKVDGGHLTPSTPRTWDLVLAASRQILEVAESAQTPSLEFLCNTLIRLYQLHPHRACWKEIGDRVEHGAIFLKDPAWWARKGSTTASTIHGILEEFWCHMFMEETYSGSPSQGLEVERTTGSADEGSDVDGDTAHKLLVWQIDGP